MDAPFTMAEIEAAVHHLTRNTAPGRDRIPNKLLRNIDYVALEKLLEFFNSDWQPGTLPQEWEHAEIALIPKPNKLLITKNLRPISLTSCVGKLLQHMVHNRLSPHIEENGYFPHTMYGSRPHLSAQDILLHIKDDLVDTLNNQS